MLLHPRIIDTKADVDDALRTGEMSAYVSSNDNWTLAAFWSVFDAMSISRGMSRYASGPHMKFTLFSSSNVDFSRSAIHPRTPIWYHVNVIITLHGVSKKNVNVLGEIYRHDYMYWKDIGIYIYNNSLYLSSKLVYAVRTNGYLDLFRDFNELK